ncbi:hypothetical protein A1351_22950 [Methylosinus sp. R-45379]|nr:hypothetical protein A1351_22950 [Methylosinus sp. R-45379]
MTPRTRAVLINTPHNPTGCVFSRRDLEQIAQIAHDNDLTLISDEVYSAFVYDGDHCSLGALGGPDAHRHIVVSSASKRFGVTGWRIGWAVAIPEISRRLRVVRQNLSACAPTPLQAAVATGLRAANSAYDARARDLYRSRRDRLYRGLVKAGFSPLLPRSGLFMLAAMDDRGTAGASACERITKSLGVTPLPLHSYCRVSAIADDYLRFAFCRPHAQFEEAVARIERAAAAVTHIPARV